MLVEMGRVRRMAASMARDIGRSSLVAATVCSVLVRSALAHAGSSEAPDDEVEASSAEGSDDSARVTGSGEVLAATSFVWRGDLYSEDLFDPNFQPYAELSVADVGPGWLDVSLWGYLPTTGGAYEIDPFIGYGISLGNWVDAELGYTAYIALNPVDAYQHELMLDLTVTGGLPVNPIVGVAVDPFVTHGAYVYGGIAATVEGKKLGLDSRLTAGGSGYEGVDPGFQDVTLTAIGSYCFTTVAYASVVAGLGYAARTQDANPWGGLAVGAAF